MAAGDFTIDTTTLSTDGAFHKVSGTVEASTSAAQADIFPGGYIVAFSVDRNIDDVDVALPRVHVNASDFSTADNGSIYIDANAGAPDTFAWTATYIA